MPSPSKKITQSATPTKQPQIPGQSTIEGFLSVSKPLNARNGDDVNNADSTSIATNPPLKRNRRICDDDDDIPMVNITLPATDAKNPVVIGDTDNECDANSSVTLQQRPISNQQTADGPKSQSKRQQSAAFADEREGMAKPVYFRY
jgi:hypothetical protein